MSGKIRFSTPNPCTPSRPHIKCSPLLVYDLQLKILNCFLAAAAAITHLYVVDSVNFSVETWIFP